MEFVFRLYHGKCLINILEHISHILLVHSCINCILMCHTCMYTCTYTCMHINMLFPALKFDKFLTGFQFITFLTNIFYISILSKHIYSVNVWWYLTNSNWHVLEKKNIYSCTLRKHIYKQKNICSGKTCLMLLSIANMLKSTLIKMWEGAVSTNSTSHIILRISLLIKYW